MTRPKGSKNGKTKKRRARSVPRQKEESTKSIVIEVEGITLTINK